MTEAVDQVEGDLLRAGQRELIGGADLEQDVEQREAVRLLAWSPATWRS